MTQCLSSMYIVNTSSAWAGHQPLKATTRVRILLEPPSPFGFIKIHGHAELVSDRDALTQGSHRRPTSSGMELGDRGAGLPGGQAGG
jgi:hypothetical protein